MLYSVGDPTSGSRAFLLATWVAYHDKSLKYRIANTGAPGVVISGPGMWRISGLQPASLGAPSKTERKEAVPISVGGSGSGITRKQADDIIAELRKIVGLLTSITERRDDEEKGKKEALDYIARLNEAE